MDFVQDDEFVQVAGQIGLGIGQFGAVSVGFQVEIQTA